jgi:hypothetical protein
MHLIETPLSVEKKVHDLRNQSTVIQLSAQKAALQTVSDTYLLMCRLKVDSREAQVFNSFLYLFTP